MTHKSFVLEYFATKFGKVAVAVPPQYTSQECSNCGRIFKKALSTRTHACQCGTMLDRDENAAINLLREGLRTVGRTGTAGFEPDQRLWRDPPRLAFVCEQLEQADSFCELGSQVRSKNLPL